MWVITFSYVSDMIAMTKLSKIMGKMAVVMKNRTGPTIVLEESNGSSSPNSPNIMSHCTDNEVIKVEGFILLSLSKMLPEVANAQRNMKRTTKKAIKSLMTSRSMKMKILVVVNILMYEINLTQIKILIKALLAAWWIRLLIIEQATGSSPPSGTAPSFGLRSSSVLQPTG